MSEALEHLRVYRSGIDGWLVIALVGVPFGLFVAFAARWLPLPAGLWIPALVVLTGLFGLLLWTLLATHYRIGKTELTVRSGPMCWRIALEQIESVRPTRDARSGPALSLDRLCISYGNGRRMLISPRDKEAFLCELERSRREIPGGRLST